MDQPWRSGDTTTGGAGVGLTTGEPPGNGICPRSFQQNSWVVLESKVWLTEQLQTNPEEIKPALLWVLASFPSFSCLFSQFSDVSGHCPAIHSWHLFMVHPCSFLFLLHSFPFLYFALFFPLSSWFCFLIWIPLFLSMDLFFPLGLVIPWFPHVITECKDLISVSVEFLSLLEFFAPSLSESSFSNSIETPRNSLSLRSVQPPEENAICCFPPWIPRKENPAGNTLLLYFIPCGISRMNPDY